VLVAERSRQRREVKDGAAPHRGPPQRARVAHIAFLDLDVLLDVGQVFPAAGREIIEQARLGATLEQMTRQVGADETRSTRDEVLFRVHGPPPARSWAGLPGGPPSCPADRAA